ncbi:hypothetical protein E2C01_026070 [Portunus trituberculatus]|uniref:Uncharacterized protein n=1 Tax=Portunus trituberculatus TaxID=210409 RepID=A0A5B7EI62_PORTR|nr:hypothetical protein [Portunus trituberculatus]
MTLRVVTGDQAQSWGQSVRGEKEEVGHSSKPGPSPRTLGKGPAGGDMQHFTSYLSPQDGILMSSFQPTGAQCHATPLWPSKPTAFCLRVDRPTFTPSITAPLHWCLPGPTQHSLTAISSEVISPIGMIAEPCLIHPAFLVLDGGAQEPFCHQDLTLHFLAWRNRTGHHRDRRAVRGMMAYITSVFDYVVGQRSDLESPVTPGQEVFRKAALVNFHKAFNLGARELHIACEHPEVARMEGVVGRSRDALNYFW